jgi:hypothetical protein
MRITRTKNTDAKIVRLNEIFALTGGWNITYDDVEVLSWSYFRKDIRQHVHTRWLFFNSEDVAHVLLELIVHRDGNIPEVEGVCVNMFQSDLFLVLNGVFESADEFVVRDFDGKNLAGVIALDETVKFEDRS